VNTAESLLRAVLNAADLNDPDAINSEYLRGQAELICNLYGINTDHKDTVIGFISLLAGVTPASGGWVCASHGEACVTHAECFEDVTGEPYTYPGPDRAGSEVAAVSPRFVLATSVDDGITITFHATRDEARAALRDNYADDVVDMFTLDKILRASDVIWEITEVPS
jgi:hypothetical protein